LVLSARVSLYELLEDLLPLLLLAVDMYLLLFQDNIIRYWWLDGIQHYHDEEDFHKWTYYPQIME
jgi:hypothetical protein